MLANLVHPKNLNLFLLVSVFLESSFAPPPSTALFLLVFVVVLCSVATLPPPFSSSRLPCSIMLRDVFLQRRHGGPNTEANCLSLQPRDCHGSPARDVTCLGSKKR